MLTGAQIRNETYRLIQERKMIWINKYLAISIQKSTQAFIELAEAFGRIKHMNFQLNGIRNRK